MFDRLKNAQEDYIRGGANFITFEFWEGRWIANLEGIFDFAELRHVSNLLKNPTTKKKGERIESSL